MPRSGTAPLDTCRQRATILYRLEGVTVNTPADKQARADSFGASGVAYENLPIPYSLTDLAIEFLERLRAMEAQAAQEGAVPTRNVSRRRRRPAGRTR